VSATCDCRWLTAPAMVERELRNELAACWREVSNAGGAVGFPFLPVSDDEVRRALEAMVDSLDPQLNRLLVASIDAAVAGWLLLAGNPGSLTAHWARVLRVQTALEHRGRGVGRILMVEVARAAREDLASNSCIWSCAPGLAWKASTSRSAGRRSGGGRRRFGSARATETRS